MKKHILSFLKRGMLFCFGGPVVLAVIYGISGLTGAVDSLSPYEVCIGILTITVMAFIAAGITTVYEIEQLPLFSAILIHGITLYADYILIYLLNGWLKSQLIPILIFTGVFIAGFALIWVIIYFVTKAAADRLNRNLKTP